MYEQNPTCVYTKIGFILERLSVVLVARLSHCKVHICHFLAILSLASHLRTIGLIWFLRDKPGIMPWSLK